MDIAHVIKITVVHVSVAVRILIADDGHVVGLVVVITGLRQTKQAYVVLVLNDRPDCVVTIRVGDEVMHLFLGIITDRFHITAGHPATVARSPMKIQELAGPNTPNAGDKKTTVET